jgi:D-glycerate 3-kinase
LSTAVSDAEIPTEDCVLTFTDYPAYELYTEVLRKGIYPESGRQLRLVVGKDRRVKDVIRL